MTFPNHAIGYIRVSTEKQNVEDQALERQADVIRRFCIKRGIEFSAIYEDVESAVGAFNLERRPALQEATAHASRENCCVIVTEPTRLFRNVGAAESWFGSSKVAVFSVRDEKILSRSEFLNAVETGAKVAKASSDGTVKALGKKRVSGAKLGSPADRSAANAASKRARAQRSDGIVDTLALILLEDSAYRDLSHRAFADLLNRRKCLTGWNRAWTAAGVKRQRGLAEQRIREWQDLDAETIADDLLVQPSVKPEQFDATISSSPEQDEDDKMRTLPTFGIF
jgi:hypothetical protein